MSSALSFDPEVAGGGEVVLAPTVERMRWVQAARDRDFLAVELAALGPAQRGRLALAIEAAVEEALERRGASPPGVGASSDLDASLSDQLYRARHIGACGLALSFASLEGIANLAGALDAEDSAVLRWWIASATERPVRLAFDAADRYLSVYSAPTTLGTLLNPALQARCVQEQAPEPTPVVVEAEPTAALEPLPEIATDAAPEPDPTRPAPAVRALDEATWRAWVRELRGARGPKPLAVIERMFVSAYVPLADAVARGLRAPEALDMLATWSASFQKSYTEAFDALRVRGKRPSMVLDVLDIALRIARLHGARSIELVLVDAMRFDLGLRLQHRLRPLLGKQAALAERILLWSALPTTTGVQLELLARGPAGLREPLAPSEELPVAKSSAATPRRLKVGHRELIKIDLVEARLAEPGAPEAERLDALADEVAAAVASHLARLAPRTLALVFGDHGFVLGPHADGTGAARQGGSTPEEALVPAFAYLVGSVH